MAVAMLVDNPNGSQETYERVRALLGVERPVGGIFHLAGPSPNGGWRVIEVWDSEEEARDFLASLERLGIATPSAPELVADPVHRVLNRLHVFPNILVGLGLYAWGGWPLVIWGVFLRLVIGLHATWFVNSAAHSWGYRTYDTPEGSTNLWWVGLIAWGEEIVLRQGVEMGRPSTLHARADGGDGLIEAVEVGGTAVVVARGEFRL